MSDKDKRGMTNRHIQLLAVGGTIGTGLFLGSGRAIALAGPSLILAYLLTSIVCFLLLRAIGEMLMGRQEDQTFVDSIRHFLGSRIAFVVSWAYWACWVALAMAEVTAIGIYVQWWLPHCPRWLPGLLVLVVLLLINLAQAGTFGEVEFWLALIKVVAILAVIAAAIVMVIASVHLHGHMVTISNLVKEGFWAHGFHGWLLALQMAVFAYVGIENVGVSAAEADEPIKVIPRAVNGVSLMVALLYCGALTAIMVMFPWRGLVGSASPFVTVFSAIGLRGAASLVNFIVLMAAASACNGSLYTAGRMFAELAGQSPRPGVSALAARSKNGVPARAVAISTLVIALATLLNLTIPSGVFTLVSSIATTSFLFIWATIILAHLRWLQSGGKTVFHMPGAPVTDWLVLIFLALVLVVMVMTTQTRVALIATLIWLGLISLASLRVKPSD